MKTKRTTIIKQKDGMDKDIPNIFTAAAENDVGALKIALAHYSVNSLDEIGMTPLHYAASTLSRDTIDELLSNPEINATLADKYARSAASLAYECFGDFANGVVEMLKPHCYPWLYSGPDNI